MIVFRFEIIRIVDNENFEEFLTKLMDIVNSSFNIDELIPNPKILKKNLRSLYRAKVTIIEVSKDVNLLKINELVNPLQIFEMTFASLRKTKGITLKGIKQI